MIDYQRNVPGWPIDVPGWERIDAGPYESLYLSRQELRGPEGATVALSDFADALGPQHGAAFALAAASLTAASGDEETACDILSDLRKRMGDAGSTPIDRELRKAGDGMSWAQECLTP